MTEPHPLRCETCTNKREIPKRPDYQVYNPALYPEYIRCLVDDHILTSDEYIHICSIGCASHSAAKAGKVLEQCETCYLKGTRACHYHGYPDDVIETSCRYKVGVDAQAALDSLKGTFIMKNFPPKSGW